MKLPADHEGDQAHSGVDAPGEFGPDDSAAMRTELKALRQLHHLNSRLLSASNLGAALTELLSATTRLLDAKMGSVRVFDPRRQALDLAAHQGLDMEQVRAFPEVPRIIASMFQTIFEGRIIVPDVEADPRFAEMRDYTRALGYRAIVSLPLKGPEEHLLGVLSIQFPQPHRPTDAQLRLLDVFAEQASLIVQRLHEAERLRESEARANAVFRQGAAGVVQTNEQGEIVAVNQRFCEMLGYSEEELLQMNRANVTADGYVVSTRNRLESIRRNQGHETFEKRYRRKDGSLFWASVSASGLTGPDDSLHGYVGLVLDIDQRHFEQKRSELMLKIEEVTRALDDPAEINLAVARLLGEHLGVDRCIYAEADAEKDHLNVTGEYFHEVSSALGRASMTQFGADALPTMRAGKPWIVNDCETDPRVTEADLDAYRRLAIRAVACVPIMRNKQLVGALAVHERGTRTWKNHEIELVETVANRMWESLARAQVAAELRERQTHLQLFADSLPHLAWSATADGVIEWCNERFMSYTGIGDPSQDGFDWCELLHPDDLEPYIRVWKESGEAGTTMSTEARLRLQSGEMRRMMVRAEPLLDATGKVQRWFATATDIEEFKRAQQARVESDALFRTLADSIPQLAWMARSDGYIYWYNRRWYEYTGTTYEQMRGSGWKQVHRPERADSVEAGFLRAVEQGASWEDTFQLRSRDGQWRWFLSRAVPILDEAGNVRSWLGTNTDVDEQRAAQAALRDADRRKDEFLATLAHELRNPLAPISNAMELMGKVAQGNASLRPLQSMLQRQVKSLVRLTDDLMEVSRISRGVIELQLEKIDLRDVVDSALETAAPVIEKFGHRLQIESRSVPVCVDPLRIAQVIGNLLNNAGKYSEQGSVIELETRAEGSRAVIRVRDQGVGFAQDQREHIFEMFAQVPGNPHAKQGLGIGLALVRNLVELHHGEVEAISPGVGMGAEFIVRLPLANQQAVVESVATAALDTARSPDEVTASVLVVDDNRDAAQSLSALLDGLGARAITAYHGEQALELFSSHDVKLVFLDIGLPDMDGYEVARKMRELSRSVRLVALTGWGQDEDRHRSMEAGFDRHLVKPIDMDVLAELIGASHGS